MEYLDILTALKGLGFVIGATSAAWALTRRLSADDASGRKRLTRDGWVAAILIIASTAVSLAAFDLENRRRLEDAKSTQLREAKRLRQLIAAGQPLTGLRVRWQFHDVSDDLHKKAQDAAREIERFPSGNADLFQTLDGPRRLAALGVVQRHKHLYPFLHAIASGTWDDSNVVALIALDDGASTLLPLGRLSYEPAEPTEDRPDRRRRHNYSSQSTKAVASGIEFDTDFDDFSKMRLNEVRRSRGFPFSGDHPYISIAGRVHTIEWDLSPPELPLSLDRIIASTPISARLPERLRLMILYDIFDLPARPDNFAVPRWRSGNYFGDSGLFAGVKFPVSRPFTRSTITLVPNGLYEVAATYDVELFKEVELEDRTDREHSCCKALVLMGARRND